MEMHERLAAALTGRYRIDREIGRGGMATVFLAEDLKHERKVALKVLHPELGVVLGVERFLTEIKTTANLQHPNILALFDSGEADGLVFYVMPYVEGETLRGRMTRLGQLSVGETVRIVQAAASALDYAHRRGVIHRDIKPENILLQDGQAMVADFGVAIAVQNATGQRITQTGMSVGTPQYMSPEQAAAEREVDGRSDQYSLAAVAYEMLAGEPPFTGPTAPAIVTKLMTEPPPPLDRRRPATPDHIVEAIHRALEKVPADRFETAAEFSEAVGSGKTGTYRAIRAAKIRRRASYLGAAAVLGIAAGIVIGRQGRATAPGDTATRRTLIELGETIRGGYGNFALARDGALIVSRDPSDAPARLVLRRLDRLVAVPVAGTELGVSPFISWNSRSLGFLRGNEIFVIPIEGGVATAVPNVRSGTYGSPDWTPDGRIVFTDSLGRLSMVRPDGSGLTALTTPAAAGAHISPRVLPNGKGVLFTIVNNRFGGSGSARIAVLSLQAREVRIVVEGGAATPDYDAGHVLYVRADRALMAVAFDQDALKPTGTPVSLGDRVALTVDGIAHYSAGRGLLVYQRVGAGSLLWLDRAGVTKRVIASEATFHSPRISPDGRRIAVDIDGAGGVADRDVWVVDHTSGTLSRLTNIGDAHDPVWTPDGLGVTFFSYAGVKHGAGPLYTVPLDRSRAPSPLRFVGGLDAKSVDTPGDWLQDGTGYVGATRSREQHGEAWLFPADGSAPRLLFNERVGVHSPRPSPDGRWLAYVGSETGRSEVYVGEMKHSGARVQVSQHGGSAPVWAHDGRMLYYLEPVGSTVNLMEASMGAGAAPAVLKRGIVIPGVRLESAVNHPNFDVSPDGRRFLIVVERDAGLVALSGWAAQLPR